MKAAQAVDADRRDLRLIAEHAEPVIQPLAIALATALGLLARDQLVFRRAVLRELAQVGSQQRGHLERAARPLRLADLDPEETSLIIEIAHDAIGHLRRAHAHEQRGQHANRRIVSGVRLGDAEVDELARLIDAQLLLAAVALADGRDILRRVPAQPALLHAPLAERLHRDERVAVGVDGHGLAEPRVQRLALPLAQVFDQAARVRETDGLAIDLGVELEEPAQMRLGAIDRAATQPAVAQMCDVCTHGIAHATALDFLEQLALALVGLGFASEGELLALPVSVDDEAPTGEVSVRTMNAFS